MLKLIKKIMKDLKTISLDGVEYVKKSDLKNHTPAEELDGLKYVIVRTYSAGVFAGYLESRDNKEVVMKNVRRLWYWEGAASLSQLAMEGVTQPNECKFSCEVISLELTEAIEILDCTKQAQDSIHSVPVWEEK